MRGFSSRHLLLAVTGSSILCTVLAMVLLLGDRDRRGETEALRAEVAAISARQTKALGEHREQLAELVRRLEVAESQLGAAQPQGLNADQASALLQAGSAMDRRLAAVEDRLQRLLDALAGVRDQASPPSSVTAGSTGG